jgi:methionyl-tRNA synthetase
MKRLCIDVSRDEPYFGFKIPHTDNKYFYVWLDAPIGYMSSLKNLVSRRKDLVFDEYWLPGHSTELYHFIGKDIAYFHTLFWPAILKSAGFRMPSAIFIHGMLTVNGQKMSKSRGTFIKASTYLQHLHPEYLRYYFAGKITHHIDDIDLNLEDFQLKVNSDLVGKVVNIASRCAGFIEKHFEGRLSEKLSEQTLFDEFVAAGKMINTCYQERDYARAMREIMVLADRANQYIEVNKPWKLIKEIDKKVEVQASCTVGLNLFRLLMIYLKPVLPVLVQKAEMFLNVPPLMWKDNKFALLNHSINQFKPLLTRIESDTLDALKKAAAEEAKSL